MKITQKEMIVRYLASRKGEWIYGYDLVRYASGADYIIQDADTRAHELSRLGYFDSTNFRYYIEHRRVGKYAEFRVARKEPLSAFIQGVGRI